LVDIGSDQRFLSPGERVVSVINYHPVVMVPRIAIAVAVFAFGLWMSAEGSGFGTVLVIGALVVLLGFFLDYRLEKLVLTDKRLLEVKGIITRTVSTMPLRALTDLRYTRSPIGLLFGWGTLIVETAGQKQALSTVRYVPNPDQFYGNIVRLTF
jgi:membrane protein YdbS with pleckstrin-like domain